MTDPITCPECQGRRGGQCDDLFLACRSCGGRGGVDGEPEPAAQQPEPPPGGPSPAWKDSRRQDPCVAGAFTCHHCLDAGQVWNVDRATATMIAVACSCVTGSAG